jgi:hypothetical protein
LRRYIVGQYRRLRLWSVRLVSQDENDCHSYGAATGTDAYFQCRMVKSQQHIAASERAQAQFQHGLDMMAAATAAPPVTTSVVIAPNLY